LFLDLGCTLENLAGGDAFDNPHDLGWTVGRNRLHQKMDMILIRSNFQKDDFVAFGNFQANGFEFFINFSGKNYPPVLCRTHDMIDQDGYIMAFTNQPTHLDILSDGSPSGKPISYAASCGECTLL
jgi:hypothetical protein